MDASDLLPVPHTTDDPAARWWCRWLTGPDAGADQRLGVGRHLLGRAHTAALRADDPALEPHHALLEVRVDGAVSVTQLTGRAPIIVDGTPLADTVELHDGSRLDVAGSTVVIARQRGRTAPAGPANIVRGALIRSPRAIPDFSPAALVAPVAPPPGREPAAGLAPALLGLTGAAAIAVVLRQPMFLLFGALGGLVAVGSWAAQRLASGRRHRRAAIAYSHEREAHLAATRRERERFLRFYHATVPTVAGAHAAIIERSASLWTRRAAHHDAFAASLGLGERPWPSTEGHPDADETGGEIQGTRDLPMPADLGPGSRLAVSGSQARSVARSLIVQLAASCGPADLRLAIVTDQPAAWACLRGLPHLTQPDGTSAIIAETSLAAMLADLSDQAAHVLLVTDQPELLATRTSPLRRALADPATRALLAVLTADQGVPHLCTSVLTTACNPVARWVVDTRATMLPVPVRVAGIGERATFACTAALHSLIDPEDPMSLATGVPRELTLGSLLTRDGGTALTPAGIVATWFAAGADPSPRTPIGMAADGMVDIDLVRDGPHGLIAGTTGAGKSELLRSLVAGMAAAASPAHTSFLLVDYKGGATFDACASLPHVVGVITDLDDHLADRALRSLHAELRRREAILRDHGAADLTTLRTCAPDVLLPRLVVVIDEFAALVAEQPGFLHALVGVAQRGRSLGVHLLLATQRPNGVISDDIRANTNLRLALRLQDTADAHDVVGTPAPALLPRGLPGRAVMRLGADDHLTFQTARCTAATSAGGETELQVLVRAIGEAARLAGAPRPPAPWRPPLMAVLDRRDVPDGAVGLIDDPDRQRTSPLTWATGEGHLLIAGSPGAGVTSTLHTLALRALTDTRRDEADVYVLDARGSDLLGGLADHPRCGAVVRLHERERLMRMLHRLRALTRSRLAGDGATSTVVWFIDGLDALRRNLDDIDTAAEFEALEEVLADAAAAGITVVAAVEHAASVPAGMLARCAHRWVMHLHDAHDATLLGVPATRVPAAGTPGRFVVAATGLVAQMVQPGGEWRDARCGPAARSTPAIAIVPAAVDASLLPSAVRLSGVTELPLGIQFVSGDVQSLRLPDDEHVLVIGGARSGRSTTLGRLAEAWQHAHPDGWVGAIVPRRSSTVVAPVTATDVSLLDRLPAHGPVLLLIDDAEAVDDPGDRLVALAAGGRPGTCIIAAGRPDALRQRYGHWTAVVRRSRTGVVHTGGSDLDGDLLGVVLPRRTPVPARPGLAWLVSDGSVHLTQVALAKSAALTRSG